MKANILTTVLLILTCEVIAQQEDIRYRPGMFATEQYLYAAQQDGLYKLDLINESSAEWELAAFAGIPIRQVVIKGDSIIATTALEGPDSLLLFSADGGNTFVDCTPASLWMQNRINETVSIQPYCMTVSPDNESVLVVDVFNSGVYKSVDFGKTWSLFPDPDIIPGVFVAYNPNDSKQLFFCYEAMTMSGEIGMSIDDGMTSMTVFETSAAWIHGIAFHPKNKSKMFAYGSGVFAVSNDQGYTWTNMKYKLKQEFGSIVFRAAVYEDNGIYAVECDNNKINIFYSHDGGYNWEMLDSIHSPSKVGMVGSLHIIGQILYINTTNAGILTFDIGKGTNKLINVSFDSSTPYYDLQGRPVANPTRGIYIRNGRKVVL